MPQPRTSARAEPGAAADRWPDLVGAALAGRRVRSVFQPIVDLRRRAVVGYEALTRFDAPDGEYRSPDRWFRAAHELGVGPDLEATTLANALSHRGALPPNCFMALNVDPDSLVVPRVRDTLVSEGDLGGIVIELTEHRAWAWDEVAPAVRTLKNRGALMAVDDAGAGYSGLQQILQLRPSILKLDRSLIEGIDRDEARVAMVEMLGRFADRIDAWVLAEGVETIGEAQRLVDLEVPLAQGYLFARPDAPWAPIDASVAGQLSEFAERSGDTLHRLVDPVAALRDGAHLLTSWNEQDERWTPVVDARDRPIGVLDAHGAFDGEITEALVTNVHSTPAGLARRLSTGPTEPATPVLIADDDGRYLGIVTLRRLLHRLGTTA